MKAELKQGDWVYSEHEVFGSKGEENIVFRYDDRINYQMDFSHKVKLVKVKIFEQ